MKRNTVVKLNHEYDKLIKGQCFFVLDTNRNNEGQCLWSEIQHSYSEIYKRKLIKSRLYNRAYVMV